MLFILILNDDESMYFKAFVPCFLEIKKAPGG